MRFSVTEVRACAAQRERAAKLVMGLIYFLMQKSAKRVCSGGDPATADPPVLPRSTSVVTFHFNDLESSS